MAVANKALAWLLFAAGGTMTALIFPVLITLYLLLALGFVPPGLEFQSLQTFAISWPGRVILFSITSLAAWHAAHRLRVLCHDLGLRADRMVAITVYGLAAGVTLAAVAWMFMMSGQ
jgi:fumarate reductase subunit D